MSCKVSTFPDSALHFSQKLPRPFRSRVWEMLCRRYKTLGRDTGQLTRIRFGDISIVAPLNHPAVYWRYERNFNRNFVATVRQTLRIRSGAIVDVGANIGDGVALLRSYGIDAPVLAIEGADIWFDLLTDNTKNDPKVFREKVFLGSGESDPGQVLHVHDGSSKLVKGESTIQIQTLDSVLQKYSDYPVALLKTDTDGFDAKVLMGARTLLVSQHPVVFAEIDEGLMREQGSSSAELMRYLTDCGYARVAIWDNYGKWLEDRSLSQGIADLVAKYPGGPETPYLDIAAFTAEDWKAFENCGGGDWREV